MSVSVPRTGFIYLKAENCPVSSTLAVSVPRTGFIYLKAGCSCSPVMYRYWRVSVPRTGFIYLKVRQPEANRKAIPTSIFGRSNLKVRFRHSLTGSKFILKALKLLNCQGSDDLAGGGGFLPVLSPAKKL